MVVVVLVALEASALLAAPSPAGAQLPSIQFDSVESEMSVGQWTRTFGSYWADFDADGDPDFLLGRHQLNAWLFAKSSDGFDRRSDNDLTKFVDRHGCAWGQATFDRKPDLYCTQGADSGGGRGHNQLLVYDGKTFEDRARALNAQDTRGRGRTANWIDYDGDNDLDLFVGNFRRDASTNVMLRNQRGQGFKRTRVGVGDHLRTVHSAYADWDNDGDPDLVVVQGLRKPVTYENVGGRFKRVSILGSFGGGWTSMAWADFDGDGWTDVHLVKGNRALVLRNVAGTFAPVHELELAGGRASAWFDLENDGDLDLFLVQGARRDGPNDETLNRRDHVLLNEGGAFEIVGGPVVRGAREGDGDSVAVVDYNRDGRQDVFVTNGYRDRSGPSELLENQSLAGNWVALDLEGLKKNPFGYGSRVEVSAGLLSYERELNDGLGSGAQSEVGVVHLGLGSATSASIEFIWPDGRRDCLDVAANQVVDLERGSAPCP